MNRREFFIYTVAGAAGVASGVPNPVVGVKMLNPPAAPVAPLVEQLHKDGITAVWARIDNFFNDATVERNVREFRKLLGGAGIQFFITGPTFLDPAALVKDPSLVGYGSNGNSSQSTQATWLQFVCPARPDFREQRIAWFVNLIRELRPTGLSMDFIRYFIYWEAVAPDRTGDSIEKFCFCDHCLGLMNTELGFHLPASAATRQAKAAWVLANHREEWTAWKCEKITSIVRDSRVAVRAVQPDVKICLHGIPWMENDYDRGLRVVVGQDLRKLAPYVDIFGPMCYFQMLHRPPEWVHEVVTDYYRLTGKAPVPSVQAAGPRRSPVPADIVLKHFVAGFESPSAGVNVYQWNSLANDPEKVAILQAAARGR